jgi:hypothetical protein
VIGKTLLRTCADLGIEVALVDGRLVIDAPEGEQADGMLAMVARLKSEVIAALTPQVRGVDPMAAGCAQPENLANFEALVRLDQQERKAGR